MPSGPGVLSEEKIAAIFPKLHDVMSVLQQTPYNQRDRLIPSPAIMPNMFAFVLNFGNCLDANMDMLRSE